MANMPFFRVIYSSKCDATGEAAAADRWSATLAPRHHQFNSRGKYFSAAYPPEHLRR
jgi:hypothetical protein